MKRLPWSALCSALGLASLLGGCGGGDRLYYNNNDLQLLTGYSAKEACSCAFVMKQTDEFCIEWTRASPNIRTVKIDRDAKTVTAQSVLFWAGRARFVSQHKGCVLE